MMQASYDYIFKYVLVGSSSVGKSSILKRFADDQFQQSYISTIGIDFRFKSLYIDGLLVKLQVWDTAGQQRFKGITKSYYKGAHAIIITYDRNSPASFEDLRKFWLNEAKLFGDAHHVFCFINKCDAMEQTQVPEEQVAFLEENDIKYYAVSAKKSYKINESIIDITKIMMQVHPKIAKGAPPLTIREVNTFQDKKKCCKG